MTFTKIAALCALASYVNLSVAAVYSGFNPQRRDRFACQIAARVTTFLKADGRSYADVMRSVRTDLRTNIAAWAGVLGYQQPIIGDTKLFYADYDYFVQNAFINLGRIDVSSLPDINWFGAYAFLAAKTETQYRLGEVGRYNLGADPELKAKIAEYLPDVRGLKWPRYEDETGQLKSAMYNCRPSWTYGTICSASDTSPPGRSEHPAFNRWVKIAQATNLIASPLFTWIIDQPLRSISYEALFERAVAEYKNPFVAIGVITWIMMVDADMGSRVRGAVVSSRLEPILYGSRDLPGHHYHFWGFTLKGMVGEGLKYKALSFVHENIIQGDRDDGLVDRMAIDFGRTVVDKINSPESCLSK